MLFLVPPFFALKSCLLPFFVCDYSYNFGLFINELIPNFEFMQEKKYPILNFSERFNSLLDSSGLKQKEIAEKSGVSATTMIHYKSGRSIPGGMELYKLAKFFGCSMEWLLTGEDEMGAPNQAIAVYRERAETAEKRLEDLKKSLIGVIKKF